MIFFGCGSSGNTEISGFPVPFKNSPASPDALKHELNDWTSNVAIVSGAGPSGLLAAYVLAKSNKYSHVIILENRRHFSRTNTLSMRPEVVTRFKALGLLDALRSISVFSDKFSYKLIDEEGKVNLFEENFSEQIDADLSGPLDSVMDGHGWPHFAVEIAALQNMLAHEVVSLPNVLLLYGSMKVMPHITGIHRAQIRYGGNKITVRHPRLIVIAEGTKSKNRARLGINFNAVPGKPDEHYCIGPVSLTNIISASSIAGRISIKVNLATHEGGFGVIRPDRFDLFVNGGLSEHETDSMPLERCIQRAAFTFLEEHRNELNLTLPANEAGLLVNEELSSFVQVKFRRADRAFSGKNTILLGDAQRSGSPSGGLGFSLVGSVENLALAEIGTRIFESDWAQALEIYEARLNEIANFWHFSNKL